MGAAMLLKTEEPENELIFLEMSTGTCSGRSVLAVVKDWQKRKFDALIEKQTPGGDTSNCMALNLSSRRLEGPHMYLAALAKGFNFAPATGNIVASVEGRARASESMATKVCMNIIGAISRVWVPPRNITLKETLALRGLDKDNNILVLPTNKDKATVEMDRADCDTKMHHTLNDESTYQPVNHHFISMLCMKLQLPSSGLAMIPAQFSYISCSSK